MPAILVVEVPRAGLQDRLRRVLVVVRDDRHLVGNGDRVGHADVQEEEDVRQHDHQDDQVQEHEHRVGHLVAEALDAIEQARGETGRGGLG